MVIPLSGAIVPIMGIIESGDIGAALFTRTQRRVLGLLYCNPERSLYANEIVRLAGVGTGAVSRELERLAQANLVSVKKIGNQKHYRANPDSPIHDELKGIVLKTFGMDALKDALSGFSGEIVSAFVYGPVDARDIEFMVVAKDLSYSDLASCIQQAEGMLGRKIRLTLYKPEYFSKRLAADASFMERMSSQPRIFLVGGEGDIPKPWVPG